MKQTIVKAIKVLIYFSFFVPLVVIPSSFIFPFIVPKILLFRSLVLVMLGAYILLLMINWQEYKPRFSALNIALAVFFASFTVSTFAGVDPYHSFWDNHERMLGLFTIFHYLSYYFICSSVFKNWDDWKKALRFFLLAGSLAMFIGVLQIFNPSLLLNQGNARVASTLGNAIYVGGYGLFLIFVAFLLIVKDKSAVWRWVYGGLGILAILGMFFSGTRGSMLGFVAGVGVVLVGYAIVLKEHPKFRRILWIISAVSLFLIIVLYLNRQTEFVSKIPAIGRTINTSLADVEKSPRWIAWQVAVESWGERPVFGWGPNNFFYAFNQHYNPRSLEFGYGETWFDNAHNIIVNTLAVQGAVGLLSYLAIFLLAICSLVVAYRQDRINPHLLVVGSAFLIAHLVQNVTVFENPTSYLYFMFWLAMIGQQTVAGKQLTTNIQQKIGPQLSAKNQKPQPDKTIGLGAVATTGIIVFLLIFIFNIQPARANMSTLSALKSLSYQPNMAINDVKRALAFNSPHIDDIRSDIGRTAAQILNNSSAPLNKEQRLELFDAIYPALQENLTLHPLDIRNQLSLFQLAQLGYFLNNDPSYFLQSGIYLEDALKHSPRRQQVIYNLANFKLQTGKGEEAVKLLEQALNDDGKISESYWRLAYAYKILGKMDKAKEVLALAGKNGIVFNDSENNLIGQILATSTPVKK